MPIFESFESLFIIWKLVILKQKFYPKIVILIKSKGDVFKKVCGAIGLYTYYTI